VSALETSERKPGTTGQRSSSHRGRQTSGAQTSGLFASTIPPSPSHWWLHRTLRGPGITPRRCVPWPVKRNRLPLDRGPNLAVLGQMRAPVAMVRVLDQMRRDLPSDLKIHVRRSLSISWNLCGCKNSRAVSEVRKVDKQAAVASENDLNDLVPSFAALHCQDDSFGAERGHIRCLVLTDSGLPHTMIARRRRSRDVAATGCLLSGVVPVLGGLSICAWPFGTA